MENTVLKEVIELLSPYNQEKEPPNITFYFSDKDGEELGDSDCCEDCIEKAKKKLRRDYGLKGKHLTLENQYNDRERDSIESCCICFRPLNRTLSSIRSEFDHHKYYNIDFESITESRTAFDLIALFNSVPSGDYNSQELMQDVIKYAGKVIDILKNNHNPPT